MFEMHSCRNKRRNRNKKIKNEKKIIAKGN